MTKCPNCHQHIRQHKDGTFKVHATTKNGTKICHGSLHRVGLIKDSNAMKVIRSIHNY